MMRTRGTGILVRDFTNPATAGSVSFILWGGNSGNGNGNHWSILFDKDNPSEVAWQFFYAKDDSQANATAWFKLKNGTGGTVATSPDVASITQRTWYNVRFDYDLADTTGGPNGTYDLTITNLDLGAVVWNPANLPIAEAVTKVDRYRAGNVTPGGSNALVDDLAVVPEPATIAVLMAGTCLLRRRRR